MDKLHEKEFLSRHSNTGKDGTMGVRILSNLPLQSVFLLKRNVINTTLSRIIKDYINIKLGGNMDLKYKIKREKE